MSSNDEEIEIDVFRLEKELHNNNNKCKMKKTIFSLLIDKSKNIYKHNEKYFVDISKNHQRYIGVLTSNFKKELFGYILYNQGDEYLGQLLNEEKNGFGIYKFNGKEKKDIYIGDFSNNNINGEGIYINIFKKDAYICNIGKFENGKFIKGKIYTMNDSLEKLGFKDDEKDKNDINEKQVIIIEKKNDINLYSKGMMKEKKLTEGKVIHIKDNGDVKHKFYFKLKDDSQYDFEYLNDEKEEKMLIDEFNNSKFVKFRKTIEDIFSQIERMIDNMKFYFQYGKQLKMGDDFKEDFSDKLNILMN